MDDEEEIYLYSWLDPKNEGKQYTEEEVREELGPLRNADELVQRMIDEGIVIPEQHNPDLDEEELYLYPWLDPKNEGKQYTEEEARRELGRGDYADRYIQELKKQGIVLYTNEDKIEDIDREYEHFKDDLQLTDDERFVGNISSLHVDDGVISRDEMLDQYYDEMAHEGYDLKGYNLVNDMLDNINQIRTLIENDFEGQEGKWADLNREIQQYAISSIEDLYTYMVESTLPAMKTVKRLTECLKERKKLQNHLVQLNLQLQEAKSSLEREQRKPGQYFKSSGSYINSSGERVQTPDMEYVNNPWIPYYGQKVRDLEQEIKETKTTIELKSIEAEELLKKIEEYSSQTIAFKEIFHSVG